MPTKGKKRTTERQKAAESSTSECLDKEETPSLKEPNPISSPKSNEAMKEITSYFPKSPSPKKASTNDPESPHSCTELEASKPRAVKSQKDTETSVSIKSDASVSKVLEEKLSTEKGREEGSGISSKQDNSGEKGKNKGSRVEEKRDVSATLLSSPGEAIVLSKKKRKQKRKETSKEAKTTQTAITEHFQVRRSQRKCKSTVEEEKRMKMENAILKGLEEGIEIRDVEGKGRGVFAVQSFSRGDFVCEYAGELIDYDTAKEREQAYSENTEIGCYMYYFTFKNKKHCVDATKESGRLGRLLNHSVHGNCTTKLVSIANKPYLTLVTSQDIQLGDELLYDYGERSKDVIESHPWLKS